MAVTVVTKSNFSGLLPSILYHIKEADFIAFDTELTGLTVNSSGKYFYFDEVEERYQKLRDSANNFGVLQFGLSAWKSKTSQGKFTNTSWAFHLFPIANGSGSDYRRWMIQISSIAFLREHKFDFNKTFLDGIGYISLEEETQLRARQELRKSDKDVMMSEEDLLFLEETLMTVQNWFDEGHEKSLELPACNSFQRLLLYQNLPKTFGEALRISKKNDQLSLQITSLEERVAADEEAKTEFEKNLLEMIGFRRLFDYLVKTEKPLVGHNCWLDICHIYQKFIGPLPTDWEKFRRGLKLGRICDTKLMATKLMENQMLEVKEGSSLKSLAMAVDDVEVWRVKVRVDGGKTKNRAKELFHDAGFDAYCTGKVFVGIATILANSRGKTVSEMVKLLFADGSEYVNRVFMMKSDYEALGINLSPDGPQETPDRKKVMIVTDLPLAIRIPHINEALAALSHERGNKFEQFWQDSKTVYILCKEGEPIETDIQLKVDDNPVTVKLISYANWHRIRNGSLPILKRLRS